MELRGVLGLAIALLVAAGGWWATEQARWLPSSELDGKPYPLRRIDLDPTPAERGLEYYGKLKLRVFVLADGRVERVEVVTATVPQRMVEQAVRAFHEAQWQPGRKAGRARRSINVVEVDFEPPAPGIHRPLSQPES